jgi:thioredoxin-like negative regulator of GroEL
LKTASLLLIVFAGCAATQRPTAGPTLVPLPPAPSPAASSPATTPVPPAPADIVFIENDYATALADARARHVPLFIDAWATWCHTCLSMKSYVFPDPALRGFASRFVWLSVDTERDENAPLVSKLGVRALPTFYVIEAASERPVVAWPGSLTAPELAVLLEDAELAARRDGTGGEATVAMLRGHQAAAAGNMAEAIAAYRAALAAAPPGWARRPEAVDALVTRLADDEQRAPCVTLGADQAPQLPPGTALADVLRAAIGCAEELPKSAPERARLAELASLGERVATDLQEPILADDRSDLYDFVLQAVKESAGEGREPAMNRVAQAWTAFLEDQASKAPSPAARAVFDAHRLLAYIALGEPGRAVPMLEQSERDFPADFNPPARLARALLLSQRYAEALSAVDRALDRGYGPRKLTLWSLEADILEARKDRPAARRALEQALRYARTVPLTGRYPRLRDALEKRLATLR